MRPHQGNRPTGNVSAIGEAWNSLSNTASEKYIKISKHNFCLDVPTQQKVIKKIKINAYHFITDFILRELIFIRHVTDTNYRKGSLWLI